MLSVIGLDPSLTHTAGFHAYDAADQPQLRGFALLSKPRAHAHAIARLRYLRDALAAELDVVSGSQSRGAA